MFENKIENLTNLIKEKILKWVEKFAIKFGFSKLKI